MMINVGSSGIHNNQNIEINNTTSNSTGSSTNVSSSSAAVKMIQGMLAGDTFNGVVTEIKGNNVLLTLDNGANLTATLTNNSNIQVGKNVTFMVNDITDSQISIKTMESVEQQSVIIDKAIDAAGIPFNDKSINIVKELLTQNMPIDKDTINQLVKSTYKFPEANLDTLTRMVKLDIPITQENIQQFEAYKTYEHSISGELNQLGKNITAFVQNEVQTTPQVFTNISNILLENNSIGNEPMHTVFNGNETIGQQLSELVNNVLKESDGVQVNSQTLQNLQNGNATVNEVFDLLKNLANSPELLNKDSLKDLLGSKEVSELLNQVIRNNMKITPEDVREDSGIKDFYNRINNEIEKLLEVTKKEGKENNLSKNLNSVKHNIEFMNDLNKNLTYIQMPIKFSENDANGELYVFTNKKKLQNSSDEVSALLHLDMQNLGPVDIYVKMAGKNVSTNFCLESEEMLDFVYAHIDELNSRLDSLGYNVKFDMKVTDKETDTIDFVTDFIDRDINSITTNQYLFDTKA